MCRTNWDVPKHRGLSVLIVKVHQPGIQIDQIKHVDGTEEFCQEFFDDVPIPLDHVVGEVDDGWTVASRLMFHERSAMGGSSPYEMGIRTSERRGGQTGVAALAELSGRKDDPRVRQLLGEARVLTKVHQALVGRIGTSIRIGKLPLPLGLFPDSPEACWGFDCPSSRWRSLVSVLSRGKREILPATSELPIWVGREVCLGGGSTEMARNIISERVLGMPREPAPDKDLPFREVRTNAIPTRH